MSDLKKLPEYSDRILHNLYADNDLKNRIISEASQPAKAAATRCGRFVKALPALACATVLLVVILSLNPIRSGNETEILDFPAGEGNTVISGSGPADTAGKSVDGTYVLTEEYEKSSLICIDDRCFIRVDNRILSDSELYGNKIGDVNEYSGSPELAEMSGISSNAVDCGTAIYAVIGMEDSFVLVPYENGCTVYQRTSYGRRNASSDLNDSGLTELCGHITAISADGKYTEIDQEENVLLSSMLLSETEFISSEHMDLGHVLDIYLDNGLYYRLSFGDLRMSGCGTWSNPGFLDEIERITK